MPKLLESALSAAGHVLWYVEFQASGAQAARTQELGRRAQLPLDPPREALAGASRDRSRRARQLDVVDGGDRHAPRARWRR